MAFFDTINELDRLIQKAEGKIYMQTHRTHVIDRSKYTQEDAIEALTAYGFREVSGAYLRFVGGGDLVNEKGERMDNPQTWDATTDRYVPVPAGGFLCYRAGADLWGRPVEGLEGVSQIAYKPLPEWEGMTGLSPREKPQCFEWVWPADHIAFVYSFAEPGWRYEAEYEPVPGGLQGAVRPKIERMIWEGEEGE